MIKFYNEPEFKVVVTKSEDVITTSEVELLDPSYLTNPDDEINFFG